MMSGTGQDGGRREQAGGESTGMVGQRREHRKGWASGGSMGGGHIGEGKPVAAEAWPR
jgi:hypothetical protein